MIIVTGGAGFIGSNLIHELNRVGEDDILLVDNFAPSKTPASPKFLNLWGARFSDYMDKTEFRRSLAAGDFANVDIRAILHQGARSSHFEEDGRYLMENNFTYSKELLSFAAMQRIPFVYASSAAVYGLSPRFSPEPQFERPLNMYGYSKLVFDNYVRRALEHPSQPIRSTVVGLRYFNVYGPREQHKGRMASVVHQFTRELKSHGTIRMFKGSGGFADGEQRRDFIFVRDLCRANLYFAGLLPESRRTPIQAVVNGGTGQARSFIDVARVLMKVHARPGRVEFIPMPSDFKESYQHFTEADIGSLRKAGFTDEFTSLEEGIRQTFAEQPPVW